MTMVGSGVDFGQKTISWLVKNKGLVKSEIYIRWTEHPFDSDLTPNNSNLDSQNQAWVGLNRIELTSVEMQSDNNLMRRLANQRSPLNFAILVITLTLILIHFI